MNLNAIIAWIRQYPVVFAFGMLSLILLVVILFRRPLVQELEQRNVRMDTEWTQMRTNVERSANLADDVDRISRYAEEVQSRLISVESVAINLDYFYRIERQLGVRILRDNQQMQVAETGARRPAHIPELRDFELVPFQITLQGSFAATMSFLQGIERGTSIVRVDSISISRDEGPAATQGRDTVTTRLEIQVLGNKANQR